MVLPVSKDTYTRFGLQELATAVGDLSDSPLTKADLVDLKVSLEKFENEEVSLIGVLKGVVSHYSLNINVDELNEMLMKKLNIIDKKVGLVTNAPSSDKDEFVIDENNDIVETGTTVCSSINQNGLEIDTDLTALDNDLTTDVNDLAAYKTSTNSSIQEIEQNVTTLDTQVTTINSVITGINTSVTNNTASVQNNETQISTNVTDIASNNTDVSTLKTYVGTSETIDSDYGTSLVSIVNSLSLQLNEALSILSFNGIDYLTLFPAQFDTSIQGTFSYSNNILSIVESDYNKRISKMKNLLPVPETNDGLNCVNCVISVANSTGADSYVSVDSHVETIMDISKTYVFMLYLDFFGNWNFVKPIKKNIDYAPFISTTGELYTPQHSFKTVELLHSFPYNKNVNVEFLGSGFVAFHTQNLTETIIEHFHDFHYPKDLLYTAKAINPKVKTDFCIIPYKMCDPYMVAKKSDETLKFKKGNIDGYYMLTSDADADKYEVYKIVLLNRTNLFTVTVLNQDYNIIFANDAHSGNLYLGNEDTEDEIFYKYFLQGIDTNTDGIPAYYQSSDNFFYSIRAKNHNNNPDIFPDNFRIISIGHRFFLHVRKVSDRDEANIFITCYESREFNSLYVDFDKDYVNDEFFRSPPLAHNLPLDELFPNKSKYFDVVRRHLNISNEEILNTDESCLINKSFIGAGQLDDVMTTNLSLGENTVKTSKKYLAYPLVAGTEFLVPNFGQALLGKFRNTITWSTPYFYSQGLRMGHSAHFFVDFDLGYRDGIR